MARSRAGHRYQPGALDAPRNYVAPPEQATVQACHRSWPEAPDAPALLPRGGLRRSRKGTTQACKHTGLAAPAVSPHLSRHTLSSIWTATAASRHDTCR